MVNSTKRQATSPFWCLCICSLLWSCQPTKPQASISVNPCPSEASIRDSFEFQICLGCRTLAQVDSFETSLGSKKISLNYYQVEASLEHKSQGKAPPSGSDLTPTSEETWRGLKYATYQRPSKANQPRSVVAYRHGDKLIYNFYQKYFYRDTVLEPSLVFGKENPFPKDTCSFHAIKEKLWSEINALKVVPAVVYEAGYHHEYYNPYGYMYGVNDRPGEYYRSEIPYPNQFRYYLWTSSLVNHAPSKIWSITLSTELSLTDEFYYTSKDGEGGYRYQIIYQTGPEDLSLKLEVNINN